MEHFDRPPTAAQPGAGSAPARTALPAEPAYEQDLDRHFLQDDEFDPDEFPNLRCISAAHMFRAVVRPVTPEPPTFVALTAFERTVEARLALAKWNTLWESAQFRRRFFAVDELPEQMAAVGGEDDVNVVFVPRTRLRYSEYAPMVHLLPRQVLVRFGLPLLRGGHWPFLIDHGEDDYLPVDFTRRLERAWAWTVWPHLVSGSPLSAFTGDDPLRLLAHNMDFWVPAVTEMMQARLSEYPEVIPDNIDEMPLPEAVALDDGSVLEGAVPGFPRMGGQIWFGEQDARLAVAEAVEAADRTGQLRGILDAVKSNRVEDDFSPRWSYAYEDFQRKLYRKRDKIQVRFVELSDTIPVQSPGSDIAGSLVTNDFLATLDVRNRQIVVLLASGMSRTEIGRSLGYANHSAISKRLARICDAAKTYFDQT